MASAMRSFMLPVGFSLSSFSRMREPFPGLTLRKASKEVLPMQCRMSGGNLFMMPVTFVWLDSTRHDFRALLPNLSRQKGARMGRPYDALRRAADS